eukprot:TRINITY_DN3093_c0_g1_i2.p1 TRINITY_DN3093_c0_g1~~TRINITY_DN3093_c0_g1_i2.p1  ORF type:complete len:513 (+),score=62.90 TRINITY_DN3093_c0_g1_i2:70-1539(+)
MARVADNSRDNDDEAPRTSWQVLPGDDVDLDAKWSIARDVYDLVALTIPLFVTSVSFVAMKTTDSSLLGHVGTEYLMASALSDLWTSSTGVLIQNRAIGMFCSQALGANNKMLVGIWLQVSYAVLAPLCVIVFVLWCLTGVVLRAFGRDEQIAADANYYAVVLALCLPTRILFSQLSTFFTSQKIMRPGVVCSTFSMVANLCFGLFFVLGVPLSGWDGYGFLACPWVTTVVELLQIALLWFVFCYIQQLHVDCWPGWSTSHITKERVMKYLGQAVPMTLSLGSDWWRVSVIGMIASSLADLDVAVWNLVYRICWMALIFTGSMGRAMSTKLALALGANQPCRARRWVVVGLGMATCVLLALCGIIILMPRQCGMIFSTDDAVLDLFELMRVSMAAFVFFMCMSVVMESVLLAVGYAQTTFWVGIVGSWLGQVPGAYLCTQYWRHDLVGLSIGATVGYAITVLLFGVISTRIDWKQVAVDAGERAEKAPR